MADESTSIGVPPVERQATPPLASDPSRTCGARPRKGRVVWLTGLSGAGKSTLARAIERHLRELGQPVYVLDGDIMRQGLCRDLGFDDAARSENVRRIGEVARILADAGILTIVACIAPFARDRLAVRERLRDFGYLEVFVDCPLDVCQQRDPKGLYARARHGELARMTGIDSPYEAPECPDLHLQTDRVELGACVSKVLDRLRKA